MDSKIQNNFSFVIGTCRPAKFAKSYIKSALFDSTCFVFASKSPHVLFLFVWNDITAHFMCNLIIFVYKCASYTGWNEIPAPPTVAQTGKHQGVIIVVLFEEFNCRSNEKDRMVIA